MKKILILVSAVALIYSCSGGKEHSESEKQEKEHSETAGGDLMKEDKTHYAPDEKGIGKFKNVEVPATLDQNMAVSGNKIYDLKCSSCHRLTGEKLVGPGWKGVTSRRKAEWVMNFVTNTDEMISKDPDAVAMLEECLVRMPNQNLSDEDARHVYEFMRKNDGVK